MHAPRHARRADIRADREPIIAPQRSVRDEQRPVLSRHVHRVPRVEYKDEFSDKIVRRRI